jgi:hypothetical protein
MPTTRKRRWRTLRRCGALRIHVATIARGVARLPPPQARFSPMNQPLRPRIQPAREIRALNAAPESESWAK